MSDERRGRHHPEERFPEEEHLSRLYREGSGDLPPANLDAVILDTARQAVRSRPRRLYFLPSRKWMVPLSLAAALWVTVEVVLLRQNEIAEQPKFSVTAPSSVVHMKPESEEKAPAENEEFDALVESGGRAKKEKRVGESAEVLGKSSAGQNLRDERQVPAEKRIALPRAAETPLPQLQKAAPRDEPAAPVGPPAREQKSAEAVLSAPAPASLPSSAISAGAMATGVTKDQALPPKEWLAKIQELRRAGKHAEAEASLREFKKRYPDYPLEKFLEKR